MNKILLLTLTLGIIGALAYAGATGPAMAADPQAPCARKKYQTELVDKACKNGGQKAAKKAMKAFVKEVKAAKKAAGEEGFKLVCTECHQSLKGDYPNKKGALKRMKKLTAFLEKSKK